MEVLKKLSIFSIGLFFIFHACSEDYRIFKNEGGSDEREKMIDLAGKWYRSVATK